MDGAPAESEPATAPASRGTGATRRPPKSPAPAAPAAEGAAPDPGTEGAVAGNAATGDPATGNPAAEAAPPAAEGDAPAAANGPAGTPAATGSRKPLSWHAVKARAGAQLKAFLMPAQESVDGDVVRLRYDAVHRFHHGQLLQRADELAALIEEVAGSGYTVLIEGPEGGAPKKIA